MSAHLPIIDLELEVRDTPLTGWSFWKHTSCSIMICLTSCKPKHGIQMSRSKKDQVEERLSHRRGCIREKQCRTGTSTGSAEASMALRLCTVLFHPKALLHWMPSDKLRDLCCYLQRMTLSDISGEGRRAATSWMENQLPSLLTAVLTPGT